MNTRIAVGWTVAVAMCAIGFVSVASLADSMDRASALDKLLGFMEKQDKGLDGQHPLSKEDKEKACKQLCGLLEQAKKENADEMNKWQDEKNNPPQDNTPGRAITQAWAAGMQARLKRIQDAGKLIGDDEARIAALCGADCCKKSAPKAGAGRKPGGGKPPSVVDTVPIEQLHRKKK